MSKFRGTKKKLHAVEIAGFYVIQDGENYEDNNVLDFNNCEGDFAKEEVRKEIAYANAKLFCASPDLLKALKDMVKMYEAILPAGGYQGFYDSAVYAIRKATEI